MNPRVGVILQLYRELSAFETPDAMERLSSTFIEALNAEVHNPLLLIPMFIFDFLCIHPFNDGNGRMRRLHTLLLLYRYYLEVLCNAYKDFHQEGIIFIIKHFQNPKELGSYLITPYKRCQKRVFSKNVLILACQPSKLPFRIY